MMCRLSGSTYSGLFMLWTKQLSAKGTEEKDIFDEDKGGRTGQPSQAQVAPQPQDPEVAHPQPPILIIGLGFGGLKFENVV